MAAPHLLALSKVIAVVLARLSPFMRRWFAAGVSLTPSLAAGRTAAAPGESTVVAPSTYTSFAAIAEKSREQRRIVNFIVCLRTAIGQGLNLACGSLGRGA